MLLSLAAGLVGQTPAKPLQPWEVPVVRPDEMKTNASTIYIQYPKSSWNQPNSEVEIDHFRVGKLAKGSLLVVKVVPGTHEIHTSIGKLGNAVAMVKTLPNEEYFFVEEFHIHGVAANSIQYTLNQVPGLNQGEGKPQPVSEGTASMLLAASHSFQMQSAKKESLPLEYLSEDEVNSAIKRGMYDSSTDFIGTHLYDVQTNVLTHLANAANNTNAGVTGFSIIIYTAPQWIEYNAAVAHRQLREFTSADVTDEMRVQALHVVALPSLSDYGATMATVMRVVITDKNKSKIVQPLIEADTSVPLGPALNSRDYRSLASTFHLGEVKQVSANGNDEWFVVVVGQNDTRRYFKVKAKLGFKL
jgi:hypothetical protein